MRVGGFYAVVVMFFRLVAVHLSFASVGVHTSTKVHVQALLGGQSPLTIEDFPRTPRFH
jgi:hypothetical protein